MEHKGRFRAVVMMGDDDHANLAPNSTLSDAVRRGKAFIRLQDLRWFTVEVQRPDGTWLTVWSNRD